MKQKKLGDILYVFDVNPYEITSDTDAEVVKVQEESFAGFIEMNPSLAEKIVKYNYHTMCVNVPEWAPYVEQEDPQETLTFGIYGSAAEANVSQVVLRRQGGIATQWTAGGNLFFPFQTECLEDDLFEVHLIEGVDPANLNITGNEYVNWGWVGEDPRTYVGLVTMSSSSISIGIDAAEPSTTHTVEIISDITMSEIMEQTPDHQTIVNTYTSPLSPFMMTVNDGNIVTVEFDNGNPYDIYDIDPNGFFAGHWENPDTGKYISWSNQIFDDVNVTIATPQPSTYTLRLDGQGISDANLAAYVGHNPTALVDLMDGIQVAEDTQVQLTLLTGDVSEYDVTNMPVWMTYVSGENPPYYIGSMPANDSTLEIDYVGAPVTHKLYLSENATSQGISDQTLGVTIDNASVTLEALVEGIDVAEDALVEVWLLTEDASDYNTSSISQWMNLSTENGLHYWRNMPAEDKTIEINLVQTVTISGDAPLTYIKELSKNKSTTINTYANPTLPVTLTVTYRNILALSAGSSSETPRNLYAMTPSNFASSSWTDSATGDKCSITNSIREDLSCELLQKRTLSLSGTDINNGNFKVTLGDVPQDLVELVNGKLVNPGTTINAWLLTENVSDYDVTSIETWMTQSTDGGLHYTATMPQADKRIDIPYVGTLLTPYTLNLTGGIMNNGVLQVKLGGIVQSLTDLTDNGVTAYTTLMVEVNLLKTDNLAYYDTSSISQWMTQDPQDPSHYTAMMPAANTTINVSYTVPSYTLSLTGTGISDYNLEVDVNGVTISYADLVNGVQANVNDDIQVHLLLPDLSNYDTSSISQWMTQDLDYPSWYEASMPAANTVIDISYTAPE